MGFLVAVFSDSRSGVVYFLTDLYLADDVFRFLVHVKKKLVNPLTR